MRPKLSIITINLNNAPGLSKTIQSVLGQTYTNFEYIIIDGGSTDYSMKLIKENEGKLTYWVSEPDNGIYNAMNKGIEKASGEYLLFLNSGDFLTNKHVIHESEQYLSNTELVYGNLSIINLGKLSNCLFPSKLTFKYFLNNSLPHPSTFIKSTMFNKVGLYNEQLKIASDWEFFIKSVCLYNCTYNYINKPISVIDTNGISRNPEMQNIIISEIDHVLKRNFSAFIVDYSPWKNRKMYFYQRFINKIMTLSKKLKSL